MTAAKALAYLYEMSPHPAVTGGQLGRHLWPASSDTARSGGAVLSRLRKARLIDQCNRVTSSGFAALAAWRSQHATAKAAAKRSSRGETRP